MNQFYNPYSWQMPSQRMQNLSAMVSTDVQCFYVNNPTDMEKVQPVLNTLYIGVNTDKKEIYLRQMNNNGLIDFTTYTQQSGEQQKSELSKILDRLDTLENNLKGKSDVQHTNGQTSDGDAIKGVTQESSVNATV